MYDILIIRGGIVGMSTASQRVSAILKKVRVLEKESGPARHQSGHNRGVIHAGIYSQSGSEIVCS